MAQVTYGPTITELTGSIGGVTYQKNASGNIAKLRSNPTVNPTSLQAIYHTRLAKLVSFWPTLSQADKDLWNAHALAHDHITSWNETKTLSGYQWFLSCNLYRLNLSSTPLSNPEAWVVYSPAQEFTLEADAESLDIVWDPAYNPTAHLLFYISLPLRQSSLKMRRSLFLSVYYDLDINMTRFNIAPYFEALANVTWADFYASANCSIICRLARGDMAAGWISEYESAIIKIN